VSHPEIRAIPLFAGMSDDACGLVAARTVASQVAAGTILAIEGSVCDPLHVVETGRVAAVRTTEAGRSARVRIDDPPVVIDKATALAGTRHLYTWTTLTACRVRRLPVRLFHELIDTEPSVTLQTARHLATQSNLARADYLDAALQDPTTRVLRRLAELADDTGIAVLAEGQDGLAAELGLSRITVNRSLQQLARRGELSVTRGRVSLRPSALARESIA
jgi:CRP-like cAMP-binding protein